MAIGLKEHACINMDYAVTRSDAQQGTRLAAKDVVVGYELRPARW